MKKRHSREQIAPVPPIPCSAKLYEEQALLGMRTAGYRITMPRVQVIRALADTTIALGAYAVHEKILDSDGKIDVVSVYRILGTLQEIGLIYHVGIVNGYFPCRLPDAVRRSEVIVNEQTNEVMELSLPSIVADEIQEQMKSHGFAVSAIKVEIMGSKK